MQAMGTGRVLVGREAQVEALHEFLQGAPAGRPWAWTRPHACYWRAAGPSPVLAGPGRRGLHASVSRASSAGMTGCVL